MHKDFQIFENRHKHEIQFIVQLLEPKIFLREEKIISQGEMGDMMYLLSYGRCSVHQKMKIS